MASTVNFLLGMKLLGNSFSSSSSSFLSLGVHKNGTISQLILILQETGFACLEGKGQSRCNIWKPFEGLFSRRRYLHC